MVAGYGQASYQIVVALGLIIALMIWQAARTPALQEEVA
jgi:branched-chain amino acid transport system permease protein